MKRIARLAIVITVFSVVSAFGQTRTEIESKFGESVNAYKVSETIWMNPMSNSFSIRLVSQTRGNLFLIQRNS